MKMSIATMLTLFLVVGCRMPTKNKSPDEPSQIERMEKLAQEETRSEYLLEEDIESMGDYDEDQPVYEENGRPNQ